MQILEAREKLRLFKRLSELRQPVANVSCVQLAPLAQQDAVDVHPVLRSVGDSFMDDQIFGGTDTNGDALDRSINCPGDRPPLVVENTHKQVRGHIGHGLDVKYERTA